MMRTLIPAVFKYFVHALNCGRILMCAAACFVLAVLCQPQTGQAGQPADGMGSRIQEQKQQIQQVEQQEATALEKLDAIDRQLAQETQRFDERSAALDALQKRIKQSQAQMSAFKKERLRNEQVLNKRLLASYKYYKRGGLKIFLSSPSYLLFLRQEYFLQHVLINDRALFADSLQLIDRETRLQDALLAQRSELVSAKESLAQQRDVIRKSRNEKAAQLEVIRSEKKLRLGALAELEQFANEMQHLVDTIPAERPSYAQQRAQFSMRMGRLVMPYKGRIISKFGRRVHPELQTSTFQKGIEISCPSGSDIAAVYDGRVVYAGWFKGYGNTMIIDHGENYFSLIAHASKLYKQVGDIITEKEVIALSGDTGSLKGALLYFEIRHHGKPQDPLLWFKRDFF